MKNAVAKPKILKDRILRASALKYQGREGEGILLTKRTNSASPQTGPTNGVDYFARDSSTFLVGGLSTFYGKRIVVSVRKEKSILFFSNSFEFVTASMD